MSLSSNDHPAPTGHLERAMTDTPVELGSILAGRYRVEEVLGRGQRGVVIAATHNGLNRRYAIKFLAGNRAGVEVHERFLREARAAVQLESQHVTRVFDVGTLDDGAPYMVMELLRGCDLSDVLRDRGRLPIEEAVGHVVQACEAIGEAHRAGIVHRDIKPANLFLAAGPSGDPCVKVLDFGVSKVNEPPGVPGSQLKLTHDTQILGSPLYMSPEQLTASKDADARSDIWSLGVTLYELCTGSVPFVAENLVGLTTAVLVKPPVPMSAHIAEVPAGFEAVVFEALNKDRDRRFQNVAAFVNALAPFAPPDAAVYVERVAKILGEQSAPARPTAVLPLMAEATTSYGSGSTSAIMAPAPPPPAARRGASLLVAGGAVLAAITLSALATVWWGVSSRPNVAGASSNASSADNTTQPAVSVSPPTEPTAEVIPSVTPSATVAVSATAGPKRKAPAAGQPTKPTSKPRPPQTPSLYGAQE